MELSTQHGSEGSFAAGLYEAELMTKEKLMYLIIDIQSCAVIHKRQVQEAVYRSGNPLRKEITPS